MKRSGSDYWKLYHLDFWEDPDVLPLSEGEAGIYLYLLGVQAQQGALPGSKEALDAIGRRFRSWSKAWPKLEKFFPLDADGLRRNARQTFELAEVDAKRAKASDRKSRFRASRRGVSTGTGRGQDADVPSMSRPRGEETREEKRRPVPTEQEAPPPATPPSPRAPRAPSGVVQGIIAAWQAEFLAATGEAYVLHPGDAPAVAALAKRAGAVTPQDARTRARMLLGAQDAFWLTNRNLRTLATRWSDVASIPVADAARSRAKPGSQASGRSTPTAAETTKYLEELRATPLPEPEDRPSLSKMLKKSLRRDIA